MNIGNKLEYNSYNYSHSEQQNECQKSQIEPEPIHQHSSTDFNMNLGLLNGTTSYDATDIEAQQEMNELLRKKKKAKRKQGFRL